LDEGDDDEEEEEDLEVEEEEAEPVGNGKQQQKKKKKPQFSLEFMQDEEDPENMTSKFIALKRLSFCAVVLNVTFVLWGVLQVCSLTTNQRTLFFDFSDSRTRTRPLFVFIFFFVFHIIYRNEC
jgi:cytoskeletal protein RodZ